MGMEKRTIGMGSMERRADGIIHTIVDFMDGDVKGLAAEYIATRSELAAGENLPTLIEIRDVPFVERSARAFLMSHVAGVPCRAVVATDPSFVTIWKSFQLVDTEAVPTKVFGNVDRAVEWIHQQLESAQDA